MTLHVVSPGFESPPRQAALCFRAILNAMSRPGKVVNTPVTLQQVDGFNPVSAMIALTLCDHETAVWLEPTFDAATRDYLAFHCNSPVTADVRIADFAFFAKCPDAGQLQALKTGTPDYPDRSATAVIQVPGFGGGTSLRLAGPGIKGSAWLSVDGLEPEFWSWWRGNNVSFPLGVDVIFTSGDAVAALPRTTRVLEQSSCT